MKSFDQAIDASIFAAKADGSKYGIFEAIMRSLSPSTSGRSGPTMTDETCLYLASATSPATSSIVMAMSVIFLTATAVPLLPGATVTSSTLPLKAIF